MPIIQHDILLKMSFKILRAVGVPEEDAETVSDHLVTSNLKGHDSHGVARLPVYVEQLRKGYVAWESHEIVREAPALAVIDGHGANGIVAMRQVVDMAVEKARKTTFGAVGLGNVTHIGRVGDFPPRIADRDMIGMVWTNVGGVFTAPFGGVDRRMRPNPISFAVPRRDGPPFMLDMTLSAVAGGKVDQKLARDEPIPEGWLVDDQGGHVADGNRFREAEVAMLPLGGLQFGHKGHGLSMMMEMIVGPLSLAGCTTGESQGGNGVLVMAIDIEPFTDLDTYKGEVEALVQWVNSSRSLPGVDRLYAPGEIEEAEHERRLRDGIDVPASTWTAISTVAGDLGVAVPVV